MVPAVAAGMSDMGGVKFFNVTLEGSYDLPTMAVVLEGFNAEVDESAEERKGGAGHLAKMLLSAGDKTLSLLCNVPKSLQEQYEHVKINDWVDKLITAAGGTVKERNDGEEVVSVLIEANPEDGLFPLKMRDAAQTAGFAFLKEKGLIPDDDDDDDYIPDPEAAGIEW
jgi:hypothetical protein